MLSSRGLNCSAVSDVFLAARNGHRLFHDYASHYGAGSPIGFLNGRFFIDILDVLVVSKKKLIRRFT